MNKRDKRIALDFLRAQRSGVTLTLKDWDRLSGREKGLWLAAKLTLERGQASAVEPEPADSEPADSDLAEDPELRRALELGADMVVERAAS